MTTNVTDLLSNMMSCDSRWSFDIPGSIDTPGFILYIDDTGFDKIVPYIGAVFMFAGDSGCIQEWKDWIASNPTSWDGHPSVDGIAMCIVDTQTNEVICEQGQDIRLPKRASFAGTGSTHAHTCWNANQCAHKAVESAKSLDIFSGGTVKYFKFEDGSNNLGNTISVSGINKQVLQKGMVMYKQPGAQIVIPVQDAAANDPIVKEVLDRVATGALSASAPCDAMHNSWTDGEVANLRTALNRVFSRS